VLIAKRSLFGNSVPTVPGGGTVAYVNHIEHSYLDDIEHREEGGTPAIIESIRAGLVFQLKEAVGVERIHARERSFIRRAIDSWKRNPDLRILGNPDLWRLSIVSFIVIHGDRHLHHGFVVALLNDLFGIQARGGCSCAGPYGHRLLGIDLERSKEFEREILRGCEGVKPGWVRVNFNYFVSETVFEFILAAIHFIADHGWKLMPHYRFEPQSGLWAHRSDPLEAVMRLADISYKSGRMSFRSNRATEPEGVVSGYIDQAHAIVEKALADLQGQRLEKLELTENFEQLRWFPLPAEILAELQTTSSRQTRHTHTP
jgi:hypothetical protein